MATKTKVTKEDLNRGYKRVNITLTIEEFDKLTIISEYKGIDHHTTAAKSLLIPEINKEAKRILVTEKYIPKTQRGLKAL